MPARTSHRVVSGSRCAHAGEGSRAGEYIREDDRQKLSREKYEPAGFGLPCLPGIGRLGAGSAPCRVAQRRQDFLDQGDLKPPFIWLQSMFQQYSVTFPHPQRADRRHSPAQACCPEISSRRSRGVASETRESTQRGRRGSSGRLVLTFVEWRFIALGHGQ